MKVKKLRLIDNEFYFRYHKQLSFLPPPMVETEHIFRAGENPRDMAIKDQYRDFLTFPMITVGSNKIPYFEQTEDPLVIAIDPGTNGCGLVVGSLRKDSVNQYMYSLWFCRESEDNEYSAEVFTYKFVEMLDIILTQNNIGELLIEQQYYHGVKNYKNIATLQSFKESCVGIFKGYNIPTTEVNNKTWKSTFLKPYKELMNIPNINSSNKDYLYKVCCEMFYGYTGYPKSTDTSDAVGIFYNYINNMTPKINYEGMPVKPIMPVKGTGKTYSSKLDTYIGRVPNISKESTLKVKELADKVAKAQKVKSVPFIINTDMNLEDNLRYLLKESSDVFYTVFKLDGDKEGNKRSYYLQVIPELFKFVYESETIKLPINKGDTFFYIGTRRKR